MNEYTKAWVALVASSLGVPRHVFTGVDPKTRFIRMGFTDNEAGLLVEREARCHLAGMYGNLDEAIQMCMPPVFRFSDEYYLAIGAWRFVDPRELTPEQRWQYQKLVLSAPFRWLLDKIARRGK